MNADYSQARDRAAQARFVASRHFAGALNGGAASSCFRTDSSHVGVKPSALEVKLNTHGASRCSWTPSKPAGSTTISASPSG
jgi:hypothetical protein